VFLASRHDGLSWRGEYINGTHVLVALLNVFLGWVCNGFASVRDPHGSLGWEVGRRDQVCSTHWIDHRRLRQRYAMVVAIESL